MGSKSRRNDVIMTKIKTASFGISERMRCNCIDRMALAHYP